MGAAYGYQLATSAGPGTTWSLGGGSLTGLALSPDAQYRHAHGRGPRAVHRRGAQQGKTASRQLTLQ